MILLGLVITRFSGRFKLLSLLQQSEGNTLAATEFIRLLEARDLLQQNNPVGRERIRSHLAPTAEFNPIT